jgi:GT2 family glycosyltransferase
MSTSAAPNRYPTTQRSGIGVAIATRNRPEALQRCLQSLGAGELVPDEVVVADQGDGDETRAATVDADSQAMPVHWLRARPGGLAVAQNEAFAQATTPIVAVLDDDCVADCNWLSAIERAFRTAPEPDLVGGRVLPLGPDRPGAFAVSSRPSAEPIEIAGRSLPWDIGSGNNFAVRREWFDRIGGCDERLGPGSPARGGVDMDLFYRLLRAGARARYEPQALVLHERTDRAGRLWRRSSYGYGMGACVTLWLRQHDGFAWKVLIAWIRMRTARLVEALIHRRWLGAYEEILVLQGTVRGIVYGLRVPKTDEQGHR